MLSAASPQEVGLSLSCRGTSSGPGHGISRDGALRRVYRLVKAPFVKRGRR